MRLWDKGEPLDDLVLRFTVGDDHLLDERLVAYDVRASVAHARMLCAQGYLVQGDCDRICAGLQELAASHARGEWRIALEQEDVHTALETRLIELIGDAGGRVHLGRSRNDQVLVALRLYLRDATQQLGEQTAAVRDALTQLAATHGDIPLPGYTHMQRAMPSSVALWAAGYAAELEDDRLGLVGCARRLELNPLGSAAGYGVPVLDLDREATTRELGFTAPQTPVTAVQLSRGKAEAGVLFELSLLASDLGRMATELVLFATAEFGFVRLPGSLTTGSSIMPQKRNPDLFELLRGRATQVPADLQAVMALFAKLPSGYHRDLQLIKAPLFRSLDAVADMLAVTTHALPLVLFDRERTEQAMDAGLTATERAYRLVESEGLPFREAYRRIAAEDT